MITQRSDLSSTQQFDSKVIKYGLLNTENRRIENFAYWHDRLVIFKEFFDEAEQSTLSVSSGLRRRRPLPMEQSEKIDPKEVSVQTDRPDRVIVNVLRKAPLFLMVCLILLLESAALIVFRATILSWLSHVSSP